MTISPMKILMVHAHREERGKLAIMLARFEHPVTFSDGIDSLEYNPDNYDLIIVDEHLTGDGGMVLFHKFSKKIRSKIIYLSSGDEKVRAFYKNSLEVYECMGKPVKPMDLAVVACDFFVSSHFNNGELATLSS
jgi:DNA-binding response OmpR family regulator